MKELKRSGGYTGHLLASGPMSRDAHEHSVLLVVSHSAELAIGLQINHAVPNQTIQDIAERIGIIMPGEDPLWYGGLKSQDRINIIHSTDWLSITSVKLTDDIAITNDISILTAISQDSGPEQFRACAGFISWPGYEIARMLKESNNNWEAVPATPDLVFGFQAGDNQWERVLEASARYQAEKWAVNLFLD
jgi:putative AlgH/UPF0301 family transcriptional regulator